MRWMQIRSYELNSYFWRHLLLARSHYNLMHTSLSKWCETFFCIHVRGILNCQGIIVYTIDLHRVGPTSNCVNVQISLFKISSYTTKNNELFYSHFEQIFAVLLRSSNTLKMREKILKLSLLKIILSIIISFWTTLIRFWTKFISFWT